MGLFDKIKEPVILKKDSSASTQLEQLQQLLRDATDDKVKATLENEVKQINAGIFGENTILYELQNSHMPIFVLQDLYLEYQSLSAQIDFLVITRGRNFVIECKNLYGDITINNSGDFIRTVWKRKEGIYSPITQSQRHLELIKQLRSNERGNVLSKTFFEHNFYENYRSVVVLANPKTVLNANYAPKEIREHVIRADQLIQYIKKVNAEPGTVFSSESSTEELAHFFLSQHKANETDYFEKYRKMLSTAEPLTEISADSSTEPETAPEENQAIVPDGEVPLCPKCAAPMVKRKAYKGEKAGMEFWGCSRFPHCHGIINIK